MYKIPTVWPVWWQGDLSGANATVLSVTPYTGAYPEHFNHVLRLRAPKTSNGWLDIAVKLPTLQTEPC